MNPLVIKMIVSIIWKLGWRAALIAHKEWTKYYKEQMALLTPEQKIEWHRDWTKDFYMGEGESPFERPGIILKDALDPAAHPDTGKLER